MTVYYHTQTLNKNRYPHWMSMDSIGLSITLARFTLYCHISGVHILYDPLLFTELLLHLCCTGRHQSKFEKSKAVSELLGSGDNLSTANAHKDYIVSSASEGENNVHETDKKPVLTSGVEGQEHDSTVASSEVVSKPASQELFPQQDTDVIPPLPVSLPLTISGAIDGIKLVS